LLEVSDEFWLPEFFGVEVAEGGVKDRWEVEDDEDALRSCKFFLVASLVLAISECEQWGFGMNSFFDVWEKEWN
jgi:hypothetical protein